MRASIIYALILILAIIVSGNSAGYGKQPSSYDEFNRVLKLIAGNETDISKEAVLAYLNMLETMPQSLWTVVLLNFITKSPGSYVIMDFEKYLKPDSEASRIALSTLYFNQWPDKFIKNIREVENSSTIYGVYASLLLSYYYSGKVPGHPFDPEKGLSYLTKASKNLNMSKEIEIFVSGEIAAILLMHLHKEEEGLKISEEILKKVSNDSDLASLFNNREYKQDLYIQMMIGYSKNNKKKEAGKYFEMLKKEFPDNKHLDLLEKEFIDPGSHPEIKIIH